MRLRGAGGPDQQDLLAGTTIFLFSTSLSMAMVLVPLVAAASGYSLAAVGFLVATAAVTQIIARMGMGPLMDRVPTKFFLILALGVILASCLLLGLSDELWVFVLSQLLQGVARAYFFTGSQMHVVRGKRSAVSALSLMNVTNGTGQLIGPVLAGVIGGGSLQTALLIAAGIAAAAMPAAMTLTRYDPFARGKPTAGERERPVWLQPGVVAAGWMGVSAGTWRSITISYLPLVLTDAGHSIPVVGILSSLANLAALLGSSIAHPVRQRGVRASAVLSTLLAIGGITAVSFVASSLWLVGLFLFISGVGGGLLQTLGPTLASEAVGPEDQGRSIAAAGTYRAVAMFVVPMGIGALVLVLPTVALATAMVATVVGLPAALIRLRGR
ncbi:MFS transporter [Cryobacterium sp. N21]|uniref:MFS transporter n=1 Tax=Cryobacterium sp. N21 TaxID=2048289 RepID=UPI000CE457E9|nr:MFS transporter [Cryobacterium sp. N21]